MLWTAVLLAALIWPWTGMAAEPLATVRAAAQQEAGAAPEAIAAYASVCNTYENRARFLPRGPSPDVLVTYADGCRAALSDLGQGGELARAAEIFLSRLALLRDTVLWMRIDGMRGGTAVARTVSQGGLAFTRTLPWVSRTGEYLIAHHMGVFRAERAWRSLDSAGARSDASPRRTGAIASPEGG